MTETTSQRDMSAEIAQDLPFLRRYARALTGSQQSGDHYAAATLEALLEDQEIFHSGLSPKVALFKAFNRIWVSSGSPVDDAGEDGSPEARAQMRLSGLTRNTREALLLHTIEGFSFKEVGQIIGVEEGEASELVQIARREMADSVTGSVMIIEDEAIIAMDIESIVAEMGHRVTGVARTRDEAVKLGKADVPDLILADIQLADNSSGIDAVNDLLRDLGNRPVIFITAFPERLLTGDKPEPAFLISKPYTVDQVVSAVSQAMFFSSTETLHS